MIRPAISVLLLSLAVAVSLPAQDKPAASGGRKATPAAGEEDTLAADTANFSGEVTGTVTSVDTAKSEMKVHVTSAKADPKKSKAPKPQSLAGRVIIVTPLLKKAKDGKETLDEASVGYIKGAKTGDAVTISVRRSSKGVAYRLLKVPSSAGQ